MITRGLQIAATGMQALMDENDVIAHNLANVNTAGFKKSALRFKSLYDARVEQTSPPGADIKSADYKYVGNISMGAQTDKSLLAFTQGTLDRTSNPLDVAIEGDGFYKIQDLDGNISYTRNGQFYINNQNKLVTREGEYVLDVRDKTVDINLRREQSTVDQVTFQGDGQIVISNPNNPKLLQKLALYDFSDKENMRQLGAGKFVPTDIQTNPPLKAEKFTLQQGAVELSNTNTITEMINSINVSRTYETLSKMVKNNSTLLQTAINLGKVRL
ncbi:MAG: flagellar hook-basal body protein [Candidatus Gastranaerophilales bacterium]|nr:flagellar hook-basal body protein [Candidatus Gastranaerophilales bacterium]